MSNQTQIEASGDVWPHDSLVIRHPNQQLGLSTTVEHGTKPVGYINQYRSGTKVRCAFCRSHMKHNVGFTVQLEDGRKALCGKDCGRKFFGKDTAKSMERRLEKQIDQQRKNKALLESQEKLPPLIAALEPWKEAQAMVILALRAVPKMRETIINQRVDEDGHLRVVKSGPDQSLTKEQLNSTRLVRHFIVLGSLKNDFGVAQNRCRTILTGKDEWGKSVSEDRRVMMYLQMPDEVNSAQVFMNRAKSFFSKTNILNLDRAVREYYSGTAKVERREQGNAATAFRLRTH